MTKNRLEAFTDAVLAIIMTILVLEIKVPHEITFEAIYDLKELFIAYIFSFFTLVVIWVNHHQMFDQSKKIDTKTLWLNSILLFFLSLFPFITHVLGTGLNKLVPNLIYGIVFSCTAISYFLVSYHLMKLNNMEDKFLVREAISISLSTICLIIGILWQPVFIAISCTFIMIIWALPVRFLKK